MGFVLSGYFKARGGIMKLQLRNELRKQRAGIDPKLREIWDSQITTYLLDTGRFKQGVKVMVYLAVGWEINTWPLASELYKRGVEIYVPVVQKDPKGLVPTQYVTSEKLVSGDFGILEPPKGTPTLGPTELDIIIVPGLAFTAKGYRIGFGGGYYDRFLPTTKAITFGLCYTSFIRDLPVDPWDQAVDFLVTEAGIRGGKS